MKFLRHFFILSFIFQMLGLMAIWSGPSFALAETATFTPVQYTPQIPIPGKADGKYNFSLKSGITLDPSTAPLAEYIRWVYKFLIGIVGILATVMLMYGGLRWIMGAADSGSINEAKSTITSSLVGLTLAVTSYLILATVNPALVNVKPTSIATVSAMGCCNKMKVGGQCGQVSADKCDGKIITGNYVCEENKCIERTAVMSTEVIEFYQKNDVEYLAIGTDEGKAACIKLGGTCMPYDYVTHCPGKTTSVVSLWKFDPCAGANKCCK